MSILNIIFCSSITCDSSNKTQLSAGLEICDIRLVSQPRGVNPSLWICPSEGPKTEFIRGAIMMAALKLNYKISHKFSLVLDRKGNLIIDFAESFDFEKF